MHVHRATAAARVLSTASHSPPPQTHPSLPRFAQQVLLGLLRNPRLNELPLGPRFWEAPTAWQHLETGGYFGQGGAAMPAVLEVRGSPVVNTLLMPNVSGTSKT